MTPTQRTIVALGLVLAAAQCLYCPTNADPADPGTYLFLWRHRWYGVGMDWPRLAAQLFATLSATAAAALVVRSPAAE